MKTAVIIQDTYNPDIHFKTYAASYIAFLLRQNGFDVHVYDRFGHFTNEELSKIAAKHKNVDFLGISAAWMFKAVSNALRLKNDDHNPPRIAKLHHFINKLNPGHIVVGGVSIDLPLGNATYVNGNSEEDIFKAFNILIPKYRSDIQTLEHRYHPQDYILPNETLPLELSRGCIFNCKFCAFAKRGRDKFDYNRDPELVADQMEHNRDVYGSTNYYFLCDTFNDTTKKIEDLANAIAKRNLKISFVSYLRHDLLHAFPEQIQILKDMGIRGAQFGLETFNHKSGKAIGKGMAPEKIKELLHKLSVEWPETMLMSIFIVGLPYSKMDEHYATVDWIKESKLLSSAAFYPLYINPRNPNASEFALNAAKYGYDMKPDNSWVYNNEFTSQEVGELATQLNDLVNGQKMDRAVWHEMTYLKSNSWKDILAEKHVKSNYMEEYKKLIGI